MKFVNPWLLLTIIPAVILWITGFLIIRKRKKRLLSLILGASADDPAACSLSKKAVWFKSMLLLAAVILLITAAARPFIREKQLAIRRDSREIMVIFDVSRSMNATDLPPSRMEQAKYLLREIFEAFPEDRFGLIPFAGKAFVSCPLTNDHHTLLQAVNELDSSSVPVGGTDLANALQTALRSMQNSGGTPRAVIVLTDGDELTGSAAKEIGELKKQHVPLLIAGFGSPEAAAPVPDGNGGLLHADDGEIAGSKLNEPLLESLAEATGGVYFRSTVTDTGISRVREFISHLDKVSLENLPQNVPEDLFPGFILAAMLLMVISAFISERVSLRNKTAVLIMVISMAVVPGAAEASDAYQIYETARKYQLAGNPQAEELYESLISGKDTPETIRARAMQNRGIISHRRAREAVEKCRQQLKSENSDEALKEIDSALAAFNQGRELYESGMVFRESGESEARRIRNYQQLLKEDTLAQELKKKIQELKQQQQQAQQQARKAQQQNQQDQKQQEQQQQQQKQQEQQQQQQQQEQQQQEQQQQQAQKETSQAAQEARELEKKARELDQQKLADQAKSAADKLDEAEKLQKEGKNREAQEKLDEAAEELKSPGQPEKTPEKKPEADQKDGKTPEKKPEAGKEGEKSADGEKRDAERQLDMLEDEAKTLQDAFRRQRTLRRRKVRKDW